MNNYTVRIEMYTKQFGQGSLHILYNETLIASHLRQAKESAVMLAKETHKFFATCEVEFSKTQYWFKPLSHVRGECEGTENRPDGFVSAAIMIYWEK